MKNGTLYDPRAPKALGNSHRDILKRYHLRKAKSGHIKARRLAGFKDYATNIPASTMSTAKVIINYHNLRG